MQDDLTQAATPEPASPGGAQVPETTPAEGSTQPEPQTDKPITLEDVSRIAREEATKIAQSQVAKGENRINQRIQERFAALEQTKGVLKLTDEQVAEAKKNIVNDVYSQPEAQASDTQPDTEQMHPLAQIAFPIFEEIGTTVGEGDPEFEKLKPYLQDPSPSAAKLAKFTRDAYTAAETKRDRLAGNKDKAAIRAPRGGGNIPSDPNDISGITDSKTLYKMGEQKHRREK